MEFDVVRNDIVNMEVDAVVLPANPRLWEGSGASKAIYERAGRKELRDACKEIRKANDKLQAGMAVATLGFGLEASFIIHAVVPKWKNGRHGEYAQLSTTYLAALDLGDALDCESLAFPLLASGNNGFDINLAYEIARQSIESYTPKNKLQKVYMVVYDVNSMALMRKLGIEVLKEIDSEYVMRHHAYQVHHLWDKVEDGKKRLLEYLGREEVQEQLLDLGKEIAQEAINKMRERRKK